MAKGTCSVEGCERTAVGRGLCGSHWMRWRRAQGDDFRPLYGDVEARFWSKVDRRGPDECWSWLGTIERTGYGQFFTNGSPRLAKAHCVAYQLLVGPIPEGQDLDHACHTADATCTAGDDCPHRRCVNPAHLEPVDPYENFCRSRNHMVDNLAKTHCIHGHLLSGDNLIIRRDGSRKCRTCKNESARRSYARRHA